MPFVDGDRVQRRNGSYTFKGEVRAAFTTRRGLRLYAVEHSAEAGLVHIFREADLMPDEEDAGKHETRDMEGLVLNVSFQPGRLDGLADFVLAGKNEDGTGGRFGLFGIGRPDGHFPKGHLTIDGRPATFGEVMAFMATTPTRVVAHILKDSYQSCVSADFFTARAGG